METCITCSFSSLGFSLREKVVSWVLASGADQPLHLASHPIQLVGHPAVHSRGSGLNFVLSTNQGFTKCNETKQVIKAIKKLAKLGLGQIHKYTNLSTTVPPTDNPDQVKGSAVNDQWATRVALSK